MSLMQARQTAVLSKQKALHLAAYYDGLQERPMNMGFRIFSAISFQRAASAGIGVLLIGLASLGCGSGVSGGLNGGAQPAPDRYFEGATVTVREYLDALDEGDYSRAYGHWYHDDLTFDEFRRQRANIAAVRADIGNPRPVDQPRGAVGVSVVTVPVELRITHTDGSSECAKGTYKVSQIVVPGAQWKIISSNVKEC